MYCEDMVISVPDFFFIRFRIIVHRQRRSQNEYKQSIFIFLILPKNQFFDMLRQRYDRMKTCSSIFLLFLSLIVLTSSGELFKSIVFVIRRVLSTVVDTTV